MKEVLIGTATYYNRRWKGIFYPEDLPTSKWFEYYCRHFKSYEINGSFYRMPTLASLMAWKNKAPEGFIFSVKAPKLITHINRFSNSVEIIDQFYNVCSEGLGAKLGCILFQLPPSFNYSQENLELIVENLDSRYKNAIEFRNEGWWTETVFDKLEKANIILCNADYLKLPSQLVATTQTGYIRMHGSPRLFYSIYSPEQIRALHDSIMKQQEWNEVFFYFNNTAGTGGILNAIDARKAFNPA